MTTEKILKRSKFVENVFVKKILLICTFTVPTKNAVLLHATTFNYITCCYCDMLKLTCI